MGRSRGGLTTKIHALGDADGRPVKLMLTPGQAGDAPVAASLLEDLAPGATLIADRAYDTNAIRELAAERDAWANIPPRKIRKGSFAFSGWVYRQRNLVERFFNRVNQFRGLATRYDRKPENFLAGLHLVSSLGEGEPGMGEFAPPEADRPTGGGGDRRIGDDPGDPLRLRLVDGISILEAHASGPVGLRVIEKAKSRPLPRTRA